MTSRSEKVIRIGYLFYYVTRVMRGVSDHIRPNHVTTYFGGRLRFGGQTSMLRTFLYACVRTCVRACVYVCVGGISCVCSVPGAFLLPL